VLGGAVLDGSLLAPALLGLAVLARSLLTCGVLASRRLGRPALGGPVLAGALLRMAGRGDHGRVAARIAGRVGWGCGAGQHADRDAYDGGQGDGGDAHGQPRALARQTVGLPEPGTKGDAENGQGRREADKQKLKPYIGRRSALRIPRVRPAGGEATATAAGRVDVTRVKATRCSGQPSRGLGVICSN
jgi:hypothetical protein